MLQKWRKRICISLILLMIMYTLPLNYTIKNVYAKSSMYTSSDKNFSFDASTGTIGKYIGSESNVVIPSQINGVTVSTIANAAFDSCESIINVEIPSNIISIGLDAFSGCKALTSITVDIGNTKYASEDGVLFNKGKTELLQYPCSKHGDYKIPSSVNIIDPNAFYGCNSLINITIPGSVISMKNAFNKCKSLVNVIIQEGITTIDDYAFGGCSSLSNITLPNSITSIGDDAFGACYSLENITIPSSINTIGDAAFDGCINLIGVYFYGNAPQIGNKVFDNTKTGFTIYYLENKSGFTNPWNGYRTSTFVDNSTTQKLSSGIKIGVVLPLTGNFSSFGISAKNGIELMKQQINNNGGVNGQVVDFIYKDDEGKPDVSANVGNDLINVDKVAAIIGPLTSFCADALAPICQSHKIPMITGTATNPNVTQIGDYIFRTCFIDPFQGKLLAEFAVKNLNAKSAAIFVNQDVDYSRTMEENFNSYFESKGGKVVGLEAYGSNDSDLNSQITKIKATNPDVIFIPDYYNKAGLIAKEIRAQGINVPLLGGDGWNSSGLIKYGGDALNNCYFTDHYTAMSTEPEVVKFINDYKRIYTNTPDTMATLFYDTANVITDAIKRAGNINNENIKNALLKTNISLVTGTLTFDSDRNPVKPGVVIKVQDGKFQFFSNIMLQDSTKPVSITSSSSIIKDNTINDLSDKTNQDNDNKSVQKAAISKNLELIVDNQAILIPIDKLNHITDNQSVVEAVTEAAMNLTAEQKESADVIDAITLFTEATVANAASKTIESGNISINTRIVTDISNKALDVKKVVENTLEQNGVETLREINTAVTLKTNEQKTLNISVDKTAANVKVDQINVQAPFVSITLNTIDIKSDTVKNPIAITVRNAGVNKVNITFKNNKVTTLKVSFPGIKGDTKYMAVVDAKGNPVGGKYNPDTKTFMAKIKASGIYSVKNNQKSFDDIKKKSKDIQDAINILTAKGFMKGKTAKKFAPDDKLTIAELASYIVNMTASLDPNANGSFKDVKKTDWFYGVAGSAKKLGIVTGNIFNGRNQVPKDQAAFMTSNTLIKEMRYKIPKNIEMYLKAYMDEKSFAKPMKPHIAMVTRENVVIKRNDKKFAPADKISRGDAAVILKKLFDRMW